MTLTEVCTYADCRVPPERHLECAARGVGICWGDLRHQHTPKRSQGGKECHVLLCDGHHDCIDNGTRYEGLRLGNAIETENGKAFYRIFDRDKDHKPEGHALVWIEISDGFPTGPSDVEGEGDGVGDSDLAPAVNGGADMDVSDGGAANTDSREAARTGWSYLEDAGSDHHVPQEVESADTDGGDRPSTVLVDTKGSHLRPPAPPSLPANPTLDFQRWQVIGQSLKDTTRRLPWLLGDWLVEGEKYGEEAWQFIDELFVNEQSVAQYEKVARTFPPEARRDDLSWSIHRRLAYAIDTLEERAEWLLKASEGEWTRDELALQLKGGTEVKRERCPTCNQILPINKSMSRTSC